MKLLKNLFRRKQTTEPPRPLTAVGDKRDKKTLPSSEATTTIPAYIEVDEREAALVSALACALAAEEQPTSQFIIKGIRKKNPEAQLIAVLAASLAAFDEPGKQFVVTRITAKQAAAVRLAS